MTDGPVTDDPVNDDPVNEGPVSDRSVTDGPVTDTPVTHNPATDDPATDDAATDDPATDRPASAGEPPWRRLSPGMLLVEPVREVIRFIPMLLILLIAGARNDDGPPWGLIGTAVVVALGIARYLSTRYRITATVVEVRRGILQRAQLTVPRDRIRTLDVSAHPLQRLLRLVRVDIGTGSSHAHNGSVRLDGLPAAAVPALRSELLHRAPARTADPVAPSAAAGGGATIDGEVELARLHRGWIALAPATLSGVLTGAVLIGFGFRLLHEARLNPADFGAVEQVLGYLRGHSVWWDVALAAAAVVIGVTILSVAGYVISYTGFRLTRHPGGTLQVTRGLVTTRSTSLAERRLRGVQRREPIVLRWVGGARLHAIVTGLRRAGGEDTDGGGSSLLMPPAPAAEVRRVEAAVLDPNSGDARPVDPPLIAHGPVARRRRYTRALAGTLPVAVGAAALTWWAGAPAPLLAAWAVVVLAAFPLAADRYRALGHAVTDGRLIVQVGSLYRRRTVLAVDGIVGVTIRRSLFQRRAGVATLIATTAAGAQHYDVPDLELRVAIDLARRLLPQWPLPPAR
ncbi:PH domain-containing protein [Nakamurella sp.]|uniref:PH domain-containing protein n=1 Tax=Nakamurella sp. TaxID=1869182 RepID=UPI003784D6F3